MWLSLPIATCAVSVQPHRALVRGFVPPMLPGLPMRLHLLILPLFNYRFGSYLEGGWAEALTTPNAKRQVVGLTLNSIGDGAACCVDSHIPPTRRVTAGWNWEGRLDRMRKMARRVGRETHFRGGLVGCRSRQIVSYSLWIYLDFLPHWATR